MLIFKMEDHSYEWHIGEELPKLGRVVRFMADGDELNLLIAAMELSRADYKGIRYTKFRGFHISPDISGHDLTRLLADTRGPKVKVT